MLPFSGNLLSICYNSELFMLLFSTSQWLQLPTYKRPGTLRAKLLYAISSNAGFELSWSASGGQSFYVVSNEVVPISVAPTLISCGKIRACLCVSVHLSFIVSLFGCALFLLRIWNKVLMSLFHSMKSQWKLGGNIGVKQVS